MPLDSNQIHSGQSEGRASQARMRPRRIWQSWPSQSRASMLMLRTFCSRSSFPMDTVRTRFMHPKCFSPCAARACRRLEWEPRALQPRAMRTMPPMASTATATGKGVDAKHGVVDGRCTEALPPAASGKGVLPPLHVTELDVVHALHALAVGNGDVYLGNPREVWQLVEVAVLHIHCHAPKPQRMLVPGQEVPGIGLPIRMSCDCLREGVVAGGADLDEVEVANVRAVAATIAGITCRRARRVCPGSCGPPGPRPQQRRRR
mmetsp:Transcript_48021/g.153564  ORF Transcript_48021/g.153564 Transcript_48021/m.153564 type:complete len:261 (+) Transcript_48021:254-1036(+)